jgi:hypothetical protein
MELSVWIISPREAFFPPTIGMSSIVTAVNGTTSGCVGNRSRVCVAGAEALRATLIVGAPGSDGMFMAVIIAAGDRYE